MNHALLHRNALLSSYQKDDTLLAFARFLKEADWRIYASEGTHTFLKTHNIPSKNVSDMVGPPILGHRVVTLSREIHAGLLAATEKDFWDLSALNIPVFGLLYCTLYPLEKTIRESKGDNEQVAEGTDVGGPALLRSAAKGRRIVVTDPEDIDLAKRLVTHGGDLTIETRLRQNAERKVSHYTKLSADFLFDYEQDLIGVES